MTAEVERLLLNVHVAVLVQQLAVVGATVATAMQVVNVEQLLREFAVQSALLADGIVVLGAIDVVRALFSGRADRESGDLLDRHIGKQRGPWADGRVGGRSATEYRHLTVSAQDKNEEEMWLPASPAARRP